MTEIDRDTEEQGDDYQYSGEIADNIKSNIVDFSGYIYKTGPNKGKFKEEFYKKIKGSFKFINTKNKKGTLQLIMNTPQAELAVGIILQNEGLLANAIDKTKLGPFRGLLNYRDLPFFTSFKKVYLDTITMITAQGGPVRTRAKGYIRSPKTNKLIKTNSKDYKKIFGKIKLKSVIIKDLSKYLTIEYDIIINCVMSFLTKHVDKNVLENANKILGYEIVQEEGITYLEIFEIAKYYNFTCIVRDYLNRIIDRYDHDKDKPNKKVLDFIIHKKHMYVKAKQQETPVRRKNVVISKLEEIEDYKYCNLIVTNPKLFDEITCYTLITCEMMDYSLDHICYKTNLVKLNIDYDEDYKILIDNNSKCKSIYNLIESDLKLKGFMNAESLNYFTEINKIRLDGDKEKTNLITDHNKSYNSQLMKGEQIIFGIPTINDYFQPFDGKIINYGIYYCEIINYDNLLAPNNTLYSGYAVIELKKQKRIKNIISQFICSDNNTVDKEDISKYSYDPVRRYIGWLQKHINVESSNYEIEEGDETDALLASLGDEAHTWDNELRINREFLVPKTGIIANLIIKDLTNIDLYNFNKKFLELNKGAKLNSIKTDSLGYILPDNTYIKPKNLVTKEKYQSDVPKYIGQFKIEDDTRLNEHFEYDPSKFKIYTHDPQPIIKEFKQETKYNQNDILNLLIKPVSFQIDAPPGYGKSHAIENIIIPYLKKNNLGYLICSTTIKSSEKLTEGRTIQGVFSKKSLYEIRKEFENISYIIIDESSQMDQKTYKQLEYIKNNTECKRILLGDRCQCKSRDAIDETWITTNFVNEMSDYNIVEFKTHENIRYTPELDEKLTHIRSIFTERMEILEYCFENFKTSKRTNTKLNLAYYHKTCDKITNKDHECYTVHSREGDTIDEDYTIHNICKMSPDIIYTALSRARSVEQITIIK